MDLTAPGLSLASFGLVMGTVVAYFRALPEGKIPVEVAGLVLKMVLGLGLAVAAIVWYARFGTSGVGGALLVGVPAAFSAMLAMTLLFFISQRKTPVGDLKVAVGDKLLPFESMTSEGKPFHTDELRGQRTLFKFFRGGW